MNQYLVDREKERRQNIVSKFVLSLETKLKRSKKSLLEDGLKTIDFKDNVKVKFEDGSELNFKYAFYVESEDDYGVFTEHCGYYTFPKYLLESINQF